MASEEKKKLNDGSVMSTLYIENGMELQKIS
jgi:hypothetical protein